MIRLDAVTKVFPGTDHPAVDRLTLEVAEGEVVVLVGPSGCGKTTTLKMINRLIEPTSGTITVAGADVTAVPAPELRRSIGYVIQQIGLFPHRTIADNIATVPRLLGWERPRIEARIDELIDLADLDPAMRDRYPSELSGGQRQRVGVARALAADPPVLLMDEPFGAVDPIVRARLQDELLDLQARLRKTIVLVTHDVDEAIKLGDRVAILNVGGVLEQYAPPAEILRSPADAFVEGFLGSDRGIKRLSLIAVRDATLVEGPIVDAAATAAEAGAAMAQHGLDWFGIRRGGLVVGWAAGSDLDGGAAPADLEPRPFATALGPDDSLRDALDAVITSHSRVAPVFDGARYLGMLTIEEISREIVQ
ncbi:MAG: ATP-binding cassette domain-containing protein [Actinobacteria bacterium]|nr:ATP-binding cassette domain-containing protein [Actinomycetota bacterium]